MVALKNAEKAWILGLTAVIAAVTLCAGAFFVVKALKSDKLLPESYDEVRKAKDFDFANVLIRSFRKTEAALNNLLDFDQAGPVVARSDALGPEDRQLLEALRKKAVFLFGPPESTEFLKFIFDGCALRFEYSPVSASVLYLTQRELIVYRANADLVKGEIGAEEITRIPLLTALDVTVEAVSRLIGRTGNECVFHEYERVIKNNPSHEMTCMERLLRVTKADGQDLVLPAGDPIYWRGNRRTADDGEGDRLSRIACEISRRIAGGKAAVESDLRAKL
jgi:hypothetical protein